MTKLETLLVRHLLFHSPLLARTRVVSPQVQATGWLVRNPTRGNCYPSVEGWS